MSEKNLWMLRIQGPDDIIAAPSKEEADKVAAAFNKFWGDYLTKQRAQSVAEGKNPDHWPTVTAAVVEWDSTPKQHASNRKRYWPDYAEYLKFAAETGKP
ncbi:hypothetical protein [Caballeronia sp. AZ7_KS35]|uniref:hypothetical protein n=1 Tax=Caballeronia sp. AZ7_KS35 TaxID=2921762 RepID=UPI002027F44F